MDKSQLREELKNSMLAKDEIKTSTLRLLLSAINYYEIQKGGAGYQATSEDVLSVIGNQAKQRRDSIAEFKKAGRQELADKEQKELEILATYLPEQVSEDEILKAVEEAITQTGATSAQDMGKVMGMVSGKLKGRADMGLVSQKVKEKLSS